jgi:hypothetical protein
LLAVKISLFKADDKLIKLTVDCPALFLADGLFACLSIAGRVDLELLFLVAHTNRTAVMGMIAKRARAGITSLAYETLY